jgi:hypothetical protein
MNEMAGFYTKSTDPSWMRRHDGGPMDSMPINPPLWHKADFDFRTAYDVNTTNTWSEAAGGSGTGLAVQDGRGGVAKFTNGASDDNYYSYFSKYEVAKLASGKDLWFWTTITIADVSEADLFVGLCAKLGSGNLFDNRVDAVGFYMTDGDATLFCECNKDGTPTQTTSAVDLSDGVEKFVGIHVKSNTKVQFYVGDAGNKPQLVTSMSTNLPDDEEMTVAFGLRNGTGSANNMTISGIKCRMDVI